MWKAAGEQTKTQLKDETNFVTVMRRNAAREASRYSEETKLCIVAIYMLTFFSVTRRRGKLIHSSTLMLLSERQRTSLTNTGLLAASDEDDDDDEDDEDDGTNIPENSC